MKASLSIIRDKWRRIQGEYNHVQRRIKTLLDVLLDAGITQEEYDTKLQELKAEQYRLTTDLETYTTADHQFHIHVGTVFDLSRRMGEIFSSSEPSMRNERFWGILLQNPTVNGKTLGFTLRSPFDTVLELAINPIQLRGQDSNLEPTP
jgi:hypothetical protein